MTCNEFQDILPDMIDGEAQGKHADHLDGCDECSDLVTDLKAIASGAKLLCAADEPSPRVWANIQRTLEAEGIIRVPLQAGTIVLPPHRRSLWAWAAPLGAVIVLAIGVLLYTGRSTTPVPIAADQVITPGASGFQVSTVPVSSVDDEQFLSEIPAGVRPMYADNLRTVNSSIQDAQQALAEDPTNDEARHFLMDAYQQKEMLYQLAMDRSVQ
jgi:hypothetical protein